MMPRRRERNQSRKRLAVEGKERGVSQAEEEACTNFYGDKKLGPLQNRQEVLGGEP